MNVHAARLTTNALTGVCGVLLLLLIAQYAGIGRGYRWSSDSESAKTKASAAAIDRKPVKLPPMSAFADIESHPLFNPDRKPTPADADSGDAGGTESASPLNVTLTGVILDQKNNVRVAMLLDKTRNQAMALRVGMPLEGDQSSWTLVELKPRSAVFRNAANETAEVPLETAIASVPASHAPPHGRAPLKPSGNQQGPGAMAQGNEDLAHRIEERRKQMREEAERLRDSKKRPVPKKH